LWTLRKHSKHADLSFLTILSNKLTFFYEKYCQKHCYFEVVCPTNKASVTMKALQIQNETTWLSDSWLDKLITWPDYTVSQSFARSVNKTGKKFAKIYYFFNNIKKNWIVTGFITLCNCIFNRSLKISWIHIDCFTLFNKLRKCRSTFSISFQRGVEKGKSRGSNSLPVYEKRNQKFVERVCSAVWHRWDMEWREGCGLKA